jgi:uncharacterized membrane protein
MMIEALFTSYLHVIVFLHVLGSIIWVGGMIVVRFVVHPQLRLIEGESSRLNFALRTTQNLFGFMFPIVLVVVLTALILAIGLDAPKESDMATYVHIKEGILTLMVLNYFYMILRRKEAQRIYNNVFYAKAKETLATISKVLLPLNIVLGIVALWMGILLRGL